MAITLALQAVAEVFRNALILRESAEE
jgi:hypothetical protein